MNLIKAILPCAAFAVASCSSTEPTLKAVNAAYKGKSSDQFFLKHGTPKSQFTLNDGSKMYEWKSDVASFSMPSATQTYGTVNSYGHYQGSSYTTGGGVISNYTVLGIHADQKGLIEDISIKKDTAGIWTFSRFNELFKEYNE